MPSRRDSQQRKAKSLNCAYARSITLVILLFVGSAPHLQAQLPKSAAPPSATTEAATPVDPLGRETPRGAVMGLLKYGELRDFATAARYLQPPPGQDTNWHSETSNLWR